MNTYKNQQGVGLLEVLVALLLLAISILGFAALQLRAVEATTEGVYRVQGINLARDLGERIRSNRNSLAEYRTQIQTATNQLASTKNCYTELCTSAELADFDVAQVRKSADSVGMTFNFLPCQGQNASRAVNAQRHCVYVAWNETSATNGTDTTACTNGNAYRESSQCIILEAY